MFAFCCLSIPCIDFASDCPYHTLVSPCSQDGGLTALVPHLIRKSKQWRDCRIEFYGLSKGDGQDQATVRMQAAQARLGHLLKKVRIDAHHTSVDASLAQMPELATCKAYDKACAKLGFDSELPEGWETRMTGNFQPTRVSRLLRLAELINQFSAKSAAMVFVMLPIPKTGTPSRQYLSLLAMLSEQTQCPTLFIRGNHEDVLTLYS